jgi:hypothetical protein
VRIGQNGYLFKSGPSARGFFSAGELFCDSVAKMERKSTISLAAEWQAWPNSPVDLREARPSEDRAKARSGADLKRF